MLLAFTRAVWRVGARGAWACPARVQARTRHDGPQRMSGDAAALEAFQRWQASVAGASGGQSRKRRRRMEEHMQWEAGTIVTKQDERRNGGGRVPGVPSRDHEVAVGVHILQNPEFYVGLWEGAPQSAADHAQRAAAAATAGIKQLLVRSVDKKKNAAPPPPAAPSFVRKDLAAMRKALRTGDVDRVAAALLAAGQRNPRGPPPRILLETIHRCLQTARAADAASLMRVMAAAAAETGGSAADAAPLTTRELVNILKDTSQRADADAVVAFIDAAVRLVDVGAPEAGGGGHAPLAPATAAPVFTVDHTALSSTGAAGPGTTPARRAPASPDASSVGLADLFAVDMATLGGGAAGAPAPPAATASAAPQRGRRAGGGGPSACAATMVNAKLLGGGAAGNLCRRRTYLSHFMSLLLREYLEEGNAAWARCSEGDATEDTAATIAVGTTNSPQVLRVHGGLNVPELFTAAGTGAMVLLSPVGPGADADGVRDLRIEADVVMSSNAGQASSAHHGAPIDIKLQTLTPFCTERLTRGGRGLRWRVGVLAGRVNLDRQLEALKRLVDGVGPRGATNDEGGDAAGDDGGGVNSSSSSSTGGSSGAVTKTAALAHPSIHRTILFGEVDEEGSGGGDHDARGPSAAGGGFDRTSPLAHLDASRLNASQTAAAVAALQRRITLIHGPPGTGKTHTAVAVIAAFVKSGRGRVLVAAESNAAVDNILDGLTRVAGGGILPVRVGRVEAVREDLRDYLVDAIAENGGWPQRGSTSTSSSSSSPPRRPRTPAGYKDTLHILRAANVVCATCSASASPMLKGMPFQLTLVDEATQATEPTCLLPILHGAQHAVLIGDPKQLPPTIMSRVADAGGLGVSLFERLIALGGTRPLLLDTQYRMHPVLAEYPAAVMYEGALRSGVDASARPAISGFAWPAPGVPAAFVHVDSNETRSGFSYSNNDEATVVAQVLARVLDAERDALDPGDIGVVTPYASQAHAIAQLLAERGVPVHRTRGGGRDRDVVSAPAPGNAVEVSSVDAFQGREKAFIIASTVRSNAEGVVGFLSCPRRLNVLLTRAQRGIVVVGNAGTLDRDARCWAPWLAWARAQKCTIEASRRRAGRGPHGSRPTGDGAVRPSQA